jgi:hypothetical protein
MVDVERDMKFAEALENVIQKHVRDILQKRERAPLPADIIETDNIGEVIEKLIIVHIRMWMLEDAVGIAETDSEVADLKRKIDICFKQKRPKYVEAINRMIENAIVTGKTLVEDSVKYYSGHTEK